LEERKNKRGAVLIAAKFQDEEGVEPVRFLREQGVDMVYVGLEKGALEGKNGRETVEVETTLDEVDPETFDFLYIPGGAAPETLRLDERALAFTRYFFETAKPVAAICHGPQVLISARVLAGRTLTCYAGIRDDVRLAGARYQDKPVVTDGNLVTSRVPGDIPALNQALVALLGLEEPETSAPA
jgi:protease I